ncbi:MAG: hypothetical protein ACRDHL_08935, partial [Candidatus Promineifilaceae bacterium]
MTLRSHRGAFWLALAAFCLLAPGQARGGPAGKPQPIRLAYATFEPLQAGEPEIPAEWRAPAGSPYALLQLQGPAQAAWAADLQALGVVFYGYLPEHVYVVRLPAGGRAAVAGHPAVRWLGPLHGAYKLSPAARGGRLALALFPG